MKYIEFLPFLPLPNTFEYKTEFHVEVGDVLRCRFGRFDTLGIAVAVHETQQTTHNLASVSEVVFRQLLTSQQSELVKTLEKYYGYSGGLFAKLFFPFTIKNAKFPNQCEMVKLNDAAVELFAKVKSKKWQEIYNTLKYGNAVESSALTGLTPFAKKGFLIFFNKNIEYKNFQEGNIQSATLPALSHAQAGIVKAITEGNDGFRTHLIHGKTGSGKTEVYAHLVKEIAKHHSKQMLILLPEIGLAKVIAERLEKRFNCKIPIWHSSTPENKRKEYFHLIQNGACNVVIGTRSALFLPFKNLEMIIVDEEHDGSYKQEESPVYNARDIAVLYGKLLNIPVVLGSATPSVESYQNAQNGKYILHELTARFADVQMPEIHIVNEKTKGFLSESVKTKILEYYDADKQVLVFLNRRGFAPVNRCASCGDIFKCSSCDALLTYHKKKAILACHKCSYTLPVHSSCTMCGDDIQIKPSGAGVEAVHEEVIKLVKNHNKESTGKEVVIFSSDEQNTDRKLTELINNIQDGTVKIIIGTQIASKGYDFANLKLVCIVDLILKNDEIDFKSDEKLMQLFTQVAGRGGRTGERGLVLVQSKRRKEELECIMHADQKSFYEKELKLRQENFLPPFSRFIAITVFGKDDTSTSNDARKIAEEIQRNIKCNIFGPAPAPIAFIKNTYRYKILLITHKSQLDVPKKLALAVQKYNAKIDVDAISFY